MNLNSKTLNVKITRSELISLMLLCHIHSYKAESYKAEKWRKLREKLFKQLKDFDTKYLKGDE